LEYNPKKKSWTDQNSLIKRSGNIGKSWGGRHGKATGRQFINTRKKGAGVGGGARIKSRKKKRRKEKISLRQQKKKTLRIVNCRPNREEGLGIRNNEDQAG